MTEDTLTINEISKILPHRYPFLLIDKVLKRVRPDNFLKDYEKAYIIARKNITLNEPFFVGHFPENPVMPGVLQVEAMAQACALLVLKSKPKTPTLITNVDRAKFRSPVIPGDVLNIEAKVSNIRSNKIYVFEAKILKEDNQKVSEAKITAYLA